jgi:glycine C-acetyltransferase
VGSRIDIITSTLGKALGGASGGFTTGRREIVALLRQRSRPYLFSNTLAPAVVCASLTCLELLSRTTERRDRLAANTRWFREAMTQAGFRIRPGEHPIVPIMLGDAQLAPHGRPLDGDLRRGLRFPVVPRARPGSRPDQRGALAGAPRARRGRIYQGRPGPRGALTGMGPARPT